MGLVLRPVKDSDMKQLEIWLNKEHVLKWYHEANEWLDEIKERNGSFSFLSHFIVLKDDKPIGFGQYYDCFDAQEEWYLVGQPENENIASCKALLANGFVYDAEKNYYKA